MVWNGRSLGRFSYTISGFNSFESGGRLALIGWRGWISLGLTVFTGVSGGGRITGGSLGVGATHVSPAWGRIAEYGTTGGIPMRSLVFNSSRERRLLVVLCVCCPRALSRVCGGWADGGSVGGRGGGG